MTLDLDPKLVLNTLLVYAIICCMAWAGWSDWETPGSTLVLALHVLSLIFNFGFIKGFPRDRSPPNTFDTFNAYLCLSVFTFLSNCVAIAIQCQDVSSHNTTARDIQLAILVLLLIPALLRLRQIQKHKYNDIDLSEYNGTQGKETRPLVSRYSRQKNPPLSGSKKSAVAMKF